MCTLLPQLRLACFRADCNGPDRPTWDGDSAIEWREGQSNSSGELLGAEASSGECRGSDGSAIQEFVEHGCAVPFPFLTLPRSMFGRICVLTRGSE